MRTLRLAIRVVPRCEHSVTEQLCQQAIILYILSILLENRILPVNTPAA